MRRLFTKDQEKRRKQAYDFAMQAGTQSIATVVFIEIAERYGSDVYYPYGIHDSQWWAIKDGNEEIAAGIREIAQRPRVINGVEMNFPAKFSWRGK